MSTLSDLKIRLTEVLKKSETRNLTEIQRERAINDSFNLMFYCRSNNGD